jgi:hypothetical protein
MQPHEPAYRQDCHTRISGYYTGRPESSTERSVHRMLIKPEVFALCAYLVTSVITAPIFMADTFDYVSSVVGFQHTRVTDFWDFGHLLWRPLIWLLSAALHPITGTLLHLDQYYVALFLMISVVWVSGAISIVAFARVVRTLFGDVAVANWVILLFCWSEAFVNFVQTGSPYVPGLAFLCVSLNMLLVDHDQESTWRAVFGGLALAGAVLLWFPYILVVPGTLVSPLLLLSRTRWQRSKVVLAFCTCAVAGIAAYSTAAFYSGVRSLPALHSWVTASAHGITDMGGLPRALIGLARSFFNLGNDGVLFKRYLKRDPYNPVSFWSLMRFSLWKIGLFYAFSLVALYQLLAAHSRRLIALFLFTCAAPLMLFTLQYAGGDMEKYLPIYPAIYLAMAGSLIRSGNRSYFRLAALAFSVVLVFNNISALSRVKWLERKQQATRETSELVAAVPAGSMIIVSPYERLATVVYDDPFLTTLQSSQIEMRAFTMLGRSTTAQWRSDLSARIKDALDKGRCVWVSDELRQAVPSAANNWVEGDDRSISWTQVASFFQSLRYESNRKAAGRFTMLSGTPINRQIAEQWSHSRRVD